MANELRAGCRGCYIGSIFVENTCFEGQAEGKKMKNICSGCSWWGDRVRTVTAWRRRRSWLAGWCGESQRLIEHRSR